MSTQHKSFAAAAMECLGLWWSFARGKDIPPTIPPEFANDDETVQARFNRYAQLTPRSRLFDRIGRLVFFVPKDMDCRADFFYVPGDRRFFTGTWGDVTRQNVHDNQTRVALRELLSKKAALAGIAVVLIGACIAPTVVEHMTPFHPLDGATRTATVALHHF